MTAEELLERIRDIVYTTDELNMENYSYEQVEALNDAMNEIGFELEKYEFVKDDD